ncbi:integral membrane protein-like protein [Aaosphaeria arxii CBS 175.79]|uniref:Integral membrane protein-like protein n=1 Tax=Aaosphaeria arxii CBS 175.79 TaxID=1450172 RepID=A0A6A5Y9H9_9PLEO|nr:integral membrane protein-like protein [Aaosphaeria arxii CBS 175.79]KAF2022068.1 integral membrane protein-like protein [Aaosphaeria arxii CBS 175.79]
MGKAGRFACIFLPMALTIASLICTILVFSGQTNKDMSLPRDLYFIKINAKDFTADPDTILDKIPDNIEINNDLLNALQSVAKADDIKDFYKVGLWNYCEGEINDKGDEKITHCSPRKTNFWFNPIDVWNLKDTAAQKVFDDELKNGVEVYSKIAKWVFTAYVVTICLTVAEFIVGIFAIFSRWGSLATTIVSSVQTVFIIGAAGAVTAIYVSLLGVFSAVLSHYKIKAELGGSMMAVVWLGVAFSVASGFFWLISVCCCSGKSPHKKVSVEKTPYTYERVASPYLGGQQQGHQLGNMPASGHGTTGTAYEPFRHDSRV